MTVDERIERPVERHEALAQSVELLSHSVEQTNRTIAKRAHSVDLMASEHRKVERLVSQIAEGIGGVVRIVRTHEAHPSHLER